jgi:hypothetical protein
MKTKLYIAILSVVVIACAPPEEDNGGGNPNRKPEAALCSNVITYTGGITITGTANFQYRAYDSGGMGAVEATPRPIKYAEIEVLEGATQVQCGNTDSNGDFSLQLPASGKTYTLKVNSRASNSDVKVSVLDSPYSGLYYSISTAFVADGSKNVGTLTASATGDVKGGAFNIYDNIVSANEFIRAQTSGCSSTYTGCPEFTVAPKATIFWKKGFNPGSYVNQPNDGVSFVLPDSANPEDSEIYILGGIGGDVDSTDTDHFDNAIILHEYGHYIEAAMSKADSPGGSHDGDSVIDPRLAWGEGWATFLATAVSGQPYYRDTYGNPDGSTGYYFNYNLEINDNDMPGTIIDGPLDVPDYAGEGNFREFAIVRTLWDILDQHPVSSVGGDESGEDDIQGDFAEIWTILAGDNGQKKSSYAFRDFGLFMSLHASLSGASDPSTLLSFAKQRDDRQDYAAPASLTTSPCSHTISAVSTGGSGAFSASHLLRNNDFYHYSHSGGTMTVLLEKQSGSADLDLYIYPESYRYGEYSSSYASNDLGTVDGGDEQVSVNAAAGNYLVNVMVYTKSGPGTATDYQLTINGEYVCP